MKSDKVPTLKYVLGQFKNNFVILLSLTFLNALLEGINIGLYLPIIGWATTDGKQGILDDIFLIVFGQMDKAHKVLLGVTVLAVVVVLKTALKLFMNWYAISFYTSLRSFWINTLHDGYLQSELLDFVKLRNGEKLNIIGNEANLATQAISDFINLCMRVTVIVSYLFVLFSTSWRATVAFLIALAGFGFFYIIFGKKKIIRLAHQRHVNDAGQNAFLNESLLGVKQIKIYELFKSVTLKRNDFLTASKVMTVKQDFLEKMPVPIGELTLIVFAALGLAYMQISQGTTLLEHIPVVGVFVLALKPLLTQVTDAASLKIGFENRWKSIEVIHQALGDIKRPEIQGTIVVHFPLKKGIQCRKLSFSYDKIKGNVIRSLDVTIPPVGLVLIKGPSGRGKTTLIDLLQGFYKNYEGSITYDDQELKLIDLSSLRKKISYVTQEHYFFHGTIRENLIPQSTSISDNEIISVLEKVSMKEFVTSLPSGLDSLVLEGATSLSGGQKQRLSMARAILHRPAIMFLDEPTNALDSASREVIIQTLYDLAKSISVVIITHDESAFTLPETLEINLA